MIRLWDFHMPATQEMGIVSPYPTCEYSDWKRGTITNTLVQFHYFNKPYCWLGSIEIPWNYQLKVDSGAPAALGLRPNSFIKHVSHNSGVTWYYMEWTGPKALQVCMQLFHFRTRPCTVRNITHSVNSGHSCLHQLYISIRTHSLHCFGCSQMQSGMHISA